MNNLDNKSKLRKDVSSNKMFPKNDLIRIVKNKEGNVFIDPTKKSNGRGIYIAPTIEALEKVKKSNALSRGLKTKISDSLYSELENEIKTNWD